jgi:hypothetical protein
MRTIAATALVIVGFLAFRGIPAAQALGTVAGVVKDKAGAVLPGVTVRVTSTELIERVRTTVTDASGQYRVVNLPAGLYTVTFSLAGFSPVTRMGVEVAAGLTSALNAEMTVGTPNKTVTIPGQWPLVNNPSATEMLRPYVLCGLTIVPADPKVDPKIRRVPFGDVPSGPSVQSWTEHSMRTIAPQICADK